MPTNLSPKEMLDYAKICADRFVEVYMARLSVWSVALVAVVTLTGFAVQNNQKSLFLIAAMAPMGLLLLDTFIKRHYASPFLYVALKMETQALRRDSAILLFVGFTLSQRALYEQIFQTVNDDKRERQFRTEYVQTGLMQKAGLLSMITMVELVLWAARK